MEQYLHWLLRQDIYLLSTKDQEKKADEKHLTMFPPYELRLQLLDFGAV